MKVLVILCSHEMNRENSSNVKILNDTLLNSQIEVDYCGISNTDDFANYEDLISFKYKIIDTSLQLTKMFHFISQYKNELSYDWYIKIRPDIKLLEPIRFDTLCKNAINARARMYIGPKQIQYGMSINGEGAWKNIGDYFFNEEEKDFHLDDMLYIFDTSVIQNGAFDFMKIHFYLENEGIHTKAWRSRNIQLNVIGINVEFTKNNTFSGDIPPSVL